jgi:hypothetical protein
MYIPGGFEMSSSDVEGRTFDLGTTSVRLVRAGNIVQVLFSNKMEAKLFYDAAATRFKRAETEFKG